VPEVCLSGRRVAGLHRVWGDTYEDIRNVRRPCKLLIVPKDQVAELVRWLDEADITSFQTPEGYGGPTEGRVSCGLE
jgi:hypothetical protein